MVVLQFVIQHCKTFWPVSICHTSISFIWFHDSSKCSLSRSPTKYYKSFLHAIITLVLFKSVLLKEKIMLENSGCFLEAFTMVVE